MFLSGYTSVDGLELLPNHKVRLAKLFENEAFQLKAFEFVLRTKVDPKILKSIFSGIATARMEFYEEMYEKSKIDVYRILMNKWNVENRFKEFSVMAMTMFLETSSVTTTKVTIEQFEQELFGLQIPRAPEKMMCDCRDVNCSLKTIEQRKKKNPEALADSDHNKDWEIRKWKWLSHLRKLHYLDVRSLKLPEFYSLEGEETSENTSTSSCRKLHHDRVAAIREFIVHNNAVFQSVGDHSIQQLSRYLLIRRLKQSGRFDE